MEVITIKRYYCPQCGHDQLNKKGYTPDGRQRVKCLGCGKSSTIGVRKMGEAKFDPKKLLPIMHKDPIKFNREELYAMGWLIADGSLSKTHQMSITIEPSDEYALGYIKQALSISNNIKKAKCGTKRKYYSRLTWGYKHADPYWEKLGLIINKTGNEIWLPYMENSHFIRGFLDGDGCVSGKKILFTSSSIDFVQALQKTVFNIIENFGSLTFTRGAYNLQYFGTHAKALGEWLYQDSKNLRLERKYKKYLDI